MANIDFETLNSEDVIDVRDIIERIEELESSKDDHEAEPDGGHWSDEEAQELQTLTDLMDDLKGYGGDEQWRGDWYPVTLIRESYFTDYTQEMLEDCGTIPRDLPSWLHIDWEATAREVMIDYSTVEINGVSYFYR